jgi:hypothetical protein
MASAGHWLSETIRSGLEGTSESDLKPIRRLDVTRPAAEGLRCRKSYQVVCG